MSKRKVWMLVAVAAAAASFFIVVPFAQQYAGQHLGWNEQGQKVFARFAFFPILLALIVVLRWLSAKGPDRSSLPK